MIAHRATAAPLTPTVIDARESIGRYDQDLNLLVLVDARESYVRQRSPARWAQAEALASAIDVRLRADPQSVHADVLARISSEARIFVNEGRAAVAALDDPTADALTALDSMPAAGHRFEAALDAYPVRWVDRLAFEPLLFLVVLAGLAIAALVLVHSAQWMFGAERTWAQREQRRIHEDLFWNALFIEGCIVALCLVVLATHSLNNGGAVLALSVLAAACVAAAVIAERRSREIIEVLKSHDRVPVHAPAPTPETPAWAPAHTRIRTHVLSIVPPLATASSDDSVRLLGDGLQADPNDSGAIGLVASTMSRQ